MLKFFLKNKYALILIFFFGISFAMHYKVFNVDIRGIHTWRQSQTMWNIRNFYRHDANILNPRVSHFNGGKDNIYRYEFPIMQWSIAMLEKVFGERISVVRISIFIIGLISVIFFYLLLQVLGLNKLAAFGGTILFQFSPVFYYYNINPIPDNLALMGGVMYLYFIFIYIKNKKLSYLIWASIAILISTFAKLPFLMFSIISIVYFIKSIFIRKKISRELFAFALIQFIFLLPAFLWYAWVMPGWTGNPILTGIFKNSIPFNKIIEIISYHIRVMFPFILLNPSSWLFLVFSIIFYKKWQEYKNYAIYIIALIIITFLYFILEFNAIGTVHDYYMMPFLPWLYILVSIGIDFLIKINWKIAKAIIYILIFISPFFAYSLDKDNWSIEKSYFNQDVFKYKKQLKNAVPQNEQCIILNDKSYYVFSYQIDKMGHIFNNDYLPIGWIDDMVKNFGIKYMYSDSRKIDTSAAFQPYIDSLILQAGSVKVFKLKSKLYK